MTHAEVDHPMLLECGTDIGRTGSSNCRKRHSYCFGKFLCPPFTFFIMLQIDFFSIS